MLIVIVARTSIPELEAHVLCRKNRIRKNFFVCAAKGNTIFNAKRWIGKRQSCSDRQSEKKPKEKRQCSKGTNGNKTNEH